MSRRLANRINSIMDMVILKRHKNKILIISMRPAANFYWEEIYYSMNELLGAFQNNVKRFLSLTVKI